MALLIRRTPTRMAQQFGRWSAEAACGIFFLMLATAALPFFAQQAPEHIEEINKEFHFLGPDDTVLIHEEDGDLKGQIDVYAGEEESDTILSYAFTIGTRTGEHVEFKTAKVHEKYFRFAGDVQRGAGRKERDPDYLRLVGEVQIVTVDGDTGKETTETKHVILKSLGADEIQD